MVRSSPILIAVLFFSFTVASRTMYDISLKRFDCVPLMENFINVSCEIILVNRTASRTNLNITFLVIDIVEPLMTVTLLRKFITYRQFLIHVTENPCNLIQKMGEDKKTIPSLTNLLLTQVQAEYINFQTNVVEGCPFIKEKTYYIKDLLLNGVRDLPPGAPSGFYRVETVFSNSKDKKEFLKIQIYAEVVRKPIADILWN